jgi:putative protein-disulfide isomerase
MSEATLHYIYDPFCGWCWGAAPLVKAARQVLPVKAHGGGMMTGAQRQRVGPELRAYVLPHDRRIAQLTGQPFGEAYADGLLRDTTAVYDSEPPIAAILAAEEIAGRGLDLLARLQEAHYVEGQRIADDEVLVQQATALGLDGADFAEALQRVKATGVEEHIVATRQLMARTDAQGFPSMLLETGGAITRVDLQRFLGQPEALADWLRMRAPSMAAGSPANAALGCGPGSCAMGD